MTDISSCLSRNLSPSQKELDLCELRCKPVRSITEGTEIDHGRLGANGFCKQHFLQGAYQNNLFLIQNASYSTQ